MANQEQLEILKQGVKAWNQWRDEHRTIRPDLDRADLCGARLSGVNLSGADLSSADLSGAIIGGVTITLFSVIRADLSGLQRSGAFLSGANLSNADLSGANLRGAFLRGVNLSRADLSHTDLRYADLSEANLSEAQLIEADLTRADLTRVYLNGANLLEAKIGLTIFGNVDLRTVKGLETVVHWGPSTIGIDTIMHSEGDIPETFLRGAGVSDTFITYIRSLVGKPFDYYTCFISHSSKDKEFVERLYADLQRAGVRCWYAPEDLDIGDKIRPRIEESIRAYDKVLLVLSENSISSNWVAYEVERATNKEPAGIPNVLFPIRLDDAVKHCNTVWANDIRSTRNIGDFSNWKRHDDYQRAFNRLLRALKSTPQK
jgi:TIR domain/Pentapeptide repeats (8 copies)